MQSRVYASTRLEVPKLAACRLSLAIDHRVATSKFSAIERIEEVHKRFSNTPLIIYGAFSVAQSRQMILRTSTVPDNYASFTVPQAAPQYTLVD